MTNPDKRHVEIVLDRSGSMERIQEEAEKGLRVFIERLGDAAKVTTVTLRQFDTQFETVFADRTLDQIPEWHLEPRGLTALRDAVGKTINDLGDRLRNTPEKDRPGEVVVVIQTDGLENSSKEFSELQILNMITEQETKWQWKFIFLGADQNAFAVSDRWNISRNRSMSYGSHNTVGTFAATADALNRGSETDHYAFTEEDREEAAKPATPTGTKKSKRN